MILQQKVVASLPTPVEANSVYYVRVGEGFDLYVTNNSGVIVAYPINKHVPENSFRQVPLVVETEGQTEFPVEGGYTPGGVIFVRGGVTLSPTEYNASNGTSIVLATSATVGESLLVLVFTDFVVADSEPAIAFGTAEQYWAGDKSWKSLASAVRTTLLEGLSLASDVAITATDSFIAALGKIQAQVSNKAGKGENSDITGLSGLTTPLSVQQGGTGSNSGIPVMRGATVAGDGEKGLVPAPAISDQTKVLCGAGVYVPQSDPGALQKAGGTMSGALNLAPPVLVPFPTDTFDLGATTSNYVTFYQVVGPKTISSFGNAPAGVTRVVVSNGAGIKSLTVSANLQIPGISSGQSIDFTAGASACFVSLGDGAWRALWFTRPTGRALVEPPFSWAGGSVSRSINEAPVAGIQAGETTDILGSTQANTFLMTNASGAPLDITGFGAGDGVRRTVIVDSSPYPMRLVHSNTLRFPGSTSGATLSLNQNDVLDVVGRGSFAQVIGVQRNSLP